MLKLLSAIFFYLWRNWFCLWLGVVSEICGAVWAWLYRNKCYCWMPKAIMWTAVWWGCYLGKITTAFSTLAFPSQRNYWISIRIRRRIQSRLFEALLWKFAKLYKKELRSKHLKYPFPLDLAKSYSSTNEKFTCPIVSTEQNSPFTFLLNFLWSLTKEILRLRDVKTLDTQRFSQWICGKSIINCKGNQVCWNKSEILLMLSKSIDDVRRRCALY